MILTMQNFKLGDLWIELACQVPSCGEDLFSSASELLGIKMIMFT